MGNAQFREEELEYGINRCVHCGRRYKRHEPARGCQITGESCVMMNSTNLHRYVHGRTDRIPVSVMRMLKKYHSAIYALYGKDEDGDPLPSLEPLPGEDEDHEE